MASPDSVTGRYKVTLIPGDGVGPEISESVKAVFTAAHIPIDWEEVKATGLDHHGDATAAEILKDCIASLRKTRVGLKGTFFTPKQPTSHESLNVVLRRELDLFASITPVKNIANIKTRHSGIDMYLVRENIQGEYSGIEHCVVPGVVESLKIVTRSQSERVMRFAFDFAASQQREKITCVHKANILKRSDGLWRSCFLDLAPSYPQLAAGDMIVDNACMQAVVRPQQFDVVVLPNLYGSVFSNITAALVGGVGVVPSGTFGDDVAVFEPGCRHVGLDIMAQNRANPIAMILSACMMLRYLKLDAYAERVSKVVLDVIIEGKIFTFDLGGTSSTQDFTAAVIKKLSMMSSNMVIKPK